MPRPQNALFPACTNFASCGSSKVATSYHYFPERYFVVQARRQCLKPGEFSLWHFSSEEVTPRCSPQLPPEHVDERTHAAVAHIQRRFRHAFSRSQ